MNAHWTLGLVIALGMTWSGFGQQEPQGAAAARKIVDARGMTKQQLLGQVSGFEEMVRKGEKAHRTDIEMGRLYWYLGVVCETAGKFGESESALMRSVALLRRTDDGGDLSEALDSLASVHMQIAEMRKAGSEEREALELRQKLGKKLLIARSWTTLADLSNQRGDFAQARDLAQKAVDEFSMDAEATAIDKLNASDALGMALCGLKNYAVAASLMARALREAKSAPPADDLGLGIGEFLLGYAHWKSGDVADAGREMKEGAKMMSMNGALEHPLYVTVLRQYAKFLHEMKDVEETKDVERQLRQAEAVVDVGVLRTETGAFGFERLR